MLFRGHGLSGGAIASLFVIWSVTSFVLEIPSGAWADTVDRRTLLVLSAVVYAAGFSSWMLFPTYAGFALGFVLWGLSGAMMSGTFEALLYDELVAQSAASHYARIRGLASATAMTAALVATGAAAPLFEVGGYQLVGWISVAVAMLHGGLALLLPRAPRGPLADDAATAAGFVAGYLTMLRSGVREAATVSLVRRTVIVTSAMIGLTAYDEYFPLVVDERGVATATVPWFVALFVAGQALGTGLAGRTARCSPRVIGWLYGAGGTLVSAGVLIGHPGGLLLAAVGYGLLNNAFIVGEARLQEVVVGSARATVTSVAGLGSEVFALTAFAVVGLGSLWWSVAVMVGVLGAPVIATAVFTGRWLPGPAGLGAREPAH